MEQWKEFSLTNLKRILKVSRESWRSVDCSDFLPRFSGSPTFAVQRPLFGASVGGGAVDSPGVGRATAAGKNEANSVENGANWCGRAIPRNPKTPDPARTADQLVFGQLKIVFKRNFCFFSFREFFKTIILEEITFLDNFLMKIYGTLFLRMKWSYGIKIICKTKNVLQKKPSTEMQKPLKILMLAIKTKQCDATHTHFRIYFVFIFFLSFRLFIIFFAACGEQETRFLRSLLGRNTIFAFATWSKNYFIFLFCHSLMIH